jgi:dTDP-4-amino-4,6-dideoxygalactose transaminase
VDVDVDTFNIDPAALEKAIEKTIKEGKLQPKVIITVDLFGLPANYPAIRKIADKYHLLILEDGAQGFGGEINGKKACSFGDISTTSFFPAKPLGCYGDGGAIFTDNDEWASLMDSLRVHGKGSFKYDNVRIGMNSRLDTFRLPF